MQGTVLYGPRDVRFEDLPDPRVVEPTDAVVRIALTCVCGSDLWPYRGLQPIKGPSPMGHEYCGVVEEVGSGVKSVKPGQFVIGSAPLGLGARIVRGDISGAAVAVGGNESTVLGAVLGAVGGVVGAFAGYQVRTRLVKVFGPRDLVVALVEDAVAIAGSFLAVSHV
jgi:threonine dehydrogenase-like Zn-dependent dehydrogenase